MKIIKVAFFGDAGSGKDWVAKNLREIYNKQTGYETIRFAFADELKRDLFNLMGLSKNQWQDFLYSESFKQERFMDFDKYEIHEYSEADKFNLLTANELEIQGSPKPKDAMQIRELCVYYGTMVMQKTMGKNIWVNKVFNSELYKKANSIDNSLITITDVRFPQEFDRCKKEGFIMVRVIMKEKEKLIKNKNIAESYISDFKEDLIFNNSLDNTKFQTELIKLLNKLNV